MKTFQESMNEIAEKSSDTEEIYKNLKVLNNFTEESLKTHMAGNVLYYSFYISFQSWEQHPSMWTASMTDSIVDEIGILDMATTLECIEFEEEIKDSLFVGQGTVREILHQHFGKEAKWLALICNNNQLYYGITNNLLRHEREGMLIRAKKRFS